MKIIITASLIFLFWFLLSGHTAPLLLFLGVVSTFITMYLSHRMNIIDHESYPFHLSARLFKYQFFLAKEVIVANIDVIKRIFKPESVRPTVFTISSSKQTDLSKVLYANSITLTPGTVTIELNKDDIKIHALCQDGADDLKTGRMAERVPDNKDIV